MADKRLLTVLLGVSIWSGASALCQVSQTIVSGSAAKSGLICSGDLVFEENFDDFDLSVWKHERTLAGGEDWQFQWYVNNRSNSFIDDGKLVIIPTLTSDVYGEEFLTSGSVNLNGERPMQSCTNPVNFGCERTGTPNDLLNVVRSAKIRTFDSFNFRYGKVEIRARLPKGDWLKPYISFTPKDYVYGDWPASGSIEMVEAKGNENLFLNGINIGGGYTSASLSWGPYFSMVSYPKSSKTFGPGFHTYTMEWTPEGFTFSVDKKSLLKVPQIQSIPFTNKDFDSPWIDGSPMAPFDQLFNINIALAVGGLTFCPDDARSPNGKPWRNDSPTAMKDFWEGKDLWLPTWRLKDTDIAAFIIDYIKVYAI